MLFDDKPKNVLYLIYGERYRREILENGRKKGRWGERRNVCLHASK